MANYYVRSGAGGAADGSTWADAYTTLAAAVAVATNADTIWVANDHAEATTGTITCPTTPGLRILGVNTNATEPPTGLASPATAVVFGGSANAVCTINGNAYIANLIIRGSSSAGGSAIIAIGTANAQQGLWFDACKFETPSTLSTGGLFLSASANFHRSDIHLVNCSMKYGAAGASVYFRHGKIHLVNFSIDSTGSTPTTAFGISNIVPTGTHIIEASDLSGESFTNLFSQANGAPAQVFFLNCKLPSTTEVTGSHPGLGGCTFRLHNCDSGDTQNNFRESSYAGTVVEEGTLVRSGGGATSYRMDSGSGTLFPFVPLVVTGTIRNTSTGSAKTLTVEILHDSATNLQNDEIWVEVLHQGTSGFPQAVLNIDDRAADVFATPADQAASSVTWTTTGMSNPNKQKLECTFTPQEAGYLTFNVCLAAPSKTVYVDMWGATVA